jgi:hypothetical protein
MSLSDLLAEEAKTKKILDKCSFRLSITFQKAFIITNETFMRTDTIHHYLIIRFLE